MSRLAHFYHVFADGRWEDAVLNHFGLLYTSGLMGELDDVLVGVVGSAENRERVRRKVPGDVVAQAESGWEQVTLTPLHEYAKVNDANILYAHTKGASKSNRISERWRESMTHDTVTRWRECVDALEVSDAAGSFWFLSDDPLHRDHNHFFAGNFWWATSTYVAGLPAVKVENRFQAEGWVGLNEPQVTVMRRGRPEHDDFWSE